mmetsp:Transcript_134543/g.348552  ORF Transcript_134543/g.348552 Transcript_134543/m.348552 type:complete len:305 (+) Transcript_134543:1149-2063(+)
MHVHWYDLKASLKHSQEGRGNRLTAWHVEDGPLGLTRTCRREHTLVHHVCTTVELLVRKREPIACHRISRQVCCLASKQLRNGHESLVRWVSVARKVLCRHAPCQHGLFASLCDGRQLPKVPVRVCCASLEKDLEGLLLSGGACRNHDVLRGNRADGPLPCGCIVCHWLVPSKDELRCFCIRCAWGALGQTLQGLIHGEQQLGESHLGGLKLDVDFLRAPATWKHASGHAAVVAAALQCDQDREACCLNAPGNAALGTDLSHLLRGHMNLGHLAAVQEPSLEARDICPSPSSNNASPETQAPEE